MSRAFSKERDDAPEPPLVITRRPHHAPEPPADRSRVGYGATVTLTGAVEGESTYTIVDEDASDARHGKFAFSSPLAEAILGKAVGESAVWHRPVGDLTVTIRAIRYD